MKITSPLFFLFIAIPLIVISAIAVIAGLYLSITDHSLSIIGQVLVVVGAGCFVTATQFIDKR